VVAFAKFAKECEKTTVILWILSTKKLISHSVIRWLSLYPSLPMCFKCTNLHIHTQARNEGSAEGLSLPWNFSPSL